MRQRKRFLVLVALLLGLFLIGTAVRSQLDFDLAPELVRTYVLGLGVMAKLGFVGLLIFRNFLLLPSMVLLTAGGLAFGTLAGTLLGGTGILLSGMMNFGIARAVAHDWGVMFPQGQTLGQVAENVNFKAEYDFAGGDADFNDVYLQFTDVPFVNKVTVGHFKEPFSLEELGSAKFLTFMERGLPNAFAPARNSGIMLNGNLWEESVTWAIGGFRQTDDFGDGFGDSDYNVSARLTGSPVYRDEGREVLHLGLSSSYRFLSNEPVAFASVPESNLGPDYVNTDDIPADSVWLLNPELAYVRGPFSLQAEYTYSSVEANSGSDPEFGGYYAYLSYFL
ncbi:MAG: hypothetical protein IH921_05625, partial [Gemmatimonadetes bacterium]|nr:hypothetical protein [Gemmatimonadota bacterium]